MPIKDAIFLFKNYFSFCPLSFNIFSIVNVRHVVKHVCLYFRLDLLMQMIFLDDMETQYS
jgi:hypothetical protein